MEKVPIFLSLKKAEFLLTDRRTIGSISAVYLLGLRAFGEMEGEDRKPSDWYNSVQDRIVLGPCRAHVQTRAKHTDRAKSMMLC